MKYVLHGIAGSCAMVAFFLMSSSIRTGALGPFAAIAAIAIVLAVAYVLIVAGIGLFGGLPPAQWASIAKQLFRGQSEA